jgi:hypothetical protein
MEIRRNIVPLENVYIISSQPMAGHVGACHPSYSVKYKWEDHSSGWSQGKK